MFNKNSVEKGNPLCMPLPHGFLLKISIPI